MSKLADQSVQVTQRSAGQEQARPLFRQPLGKSRADPSGRTGQQDNFVTKVEFGHQMDLRAGCFAYVQILGVRERSGKDRKQKIAIWTSPIGTANRDAMSADALQLDVALAG